MTDAGLALLEGVLRIETAAWYCVVLLAGQLGCLMLVAGILAYFYVLERNDRKG